MSMNRRLHTGWHSSVLRGLVCLACTTLLGAMEMIADEDIPDPYGLGPRLALIDLLREQYQVEPPAGATLRELKLLHAKQQPPPDPLAHIPADQRDEFERLRAELTALDIETTDADTIATLRDALSYHRRQTLLEQTASGQIRQTSDGGTTMAVIVDQHSLQLSMPAGFTVVPDTVLETLYPDGLGHRIAYGDPTTLYRVLLILSATGTQMPADESIDALHAALQPILGPNQQPRAVGEWRMIDDRRWGVLQVDAMQQGLLIRNHLFVTNVGGSLFIVRVCGQEEDLDQIDATLQATFASLRMH